MRGSSRAACAVALATAVVAGADVSAHRLDEYLQAARLAIEPGRVQLELDLTPGIALAEEIIAAVDRNRDGLLSQDEQGAYGRLVMSALTLEVDGKPLSLRLGVCRFPGTGAIRSGEGTVRLESAATLPRLSVGRHQLLFRNGHHRNRSVYLANALVPESDQVAVTAQQRDGDQSELTIAYVMREAPGTATRVLLFGSLAAATVLSAFLTRALRSRRSPPGEPLDT